MVRAPPFVACEKQSLYKCDFLTGLKPSGSKAGKKNKISNGQSSIKSFFAMVGNSSECSDTVQNDVLTHEPEEETSSSTSINVVKSEDLSEDETNVPPGISKIGDQSPDDIKSEMKKKPGEAMKRKSNLNEDESNAEPNVEPLGKKLKHGEIDKEEVVLVASSFFLCSPSLDSCNITSVLNVILKLTEKVIVFHAAKVFLKDVKSASRF